MVKRSDLTACIDDDSLYEVLCHWFLVNHRDLMWRNLSDPNPYYVWISEIMLQQTRVEAVKEYFSRFISRVSDIKALSEISDDELMKLWQGLGYYSRAKNLKKCAKLLMDSYDGKLPDKKEELMKLPGIGPYTAGAISSIAYGQRKACVDGNVLRVMSRLYASKMDISLEKTKRFWDEELTKLLNRTKLNPGVLNQALMELGALVCAPNKEPDCNVCPLENGCKYRIEKRKDPGLILPVKGAKKQRKKEYYIVFIIKKGDGVYLYKRPDTGLLSGLFAFPSVEISKEEYDRYSSLGTYKDHEVCVRAKHIFTHIEWHMLGVCMDKLPDILSDLTFVTASKESLTDTYAVPSAYRAFLEYMQKTY